MCFTTTEETALVPFNLAHPVVYFDGQRRYSVNIFLTEIVILF